MNISFEIPDDKTRTNTLVNSNNIVPDKGPTNLSCSINLNGKESVKLVCEYVEVDELSEKLSIQYCRRNDNSFSHVLKLCLKDESDIKEAINFSGFIQCITEGYRLINSSGEIRDDVHMSISILEEDAVSIHASFSITDMTFNFRAKPFDDHVLRKMCYLDRKVEEIEC